jgi:crotonobetaine/carnitine-CoA ligase
VLVRIREPFRTFMSCFGMPDATVTTWRYLWVRTGDGVVQDGWSWLRFVDRAKEARSPRRC